MPYHRHRLDADGTIADAKIVSWTIRRTGFRLQVFGQEKVLGGIKTLPDTHKGWSDS